MLLLRTLSLKYLPGEQEKKVPRLLKYLNVSELWSGESVANVHHQLTVCKWTIPWYDSIPLGKKIYSFPTEVA